MGMVQYPVRFPLTLPQLAILLLKPSESCVYCALRIYLSNEVCKKTELVFYLSFRSFNFFTESDYP